MNRPPCGGSTHVIPVPQAMTPDEAWAEMTTLGRLADPVPEPDWACYQCLGGDDCRCRFIDRAPDFRRWHNDVLIEDTTQRRTK